MLPSSRCAQLTCMEFIFRCAHTRVLIFTGECLLLSDFNKQTKKKKKEQAKKFW